MPGCLNNCYLYWEDHSIENADKQTRRRIIDELTKFKDTDEYDPNCLSFAIKKRCLGGYLKDGNNLPENCKHFLDLPDELSVNERMSILAQKANRKWTSLTTFIAIIGLLSSSFFAYLNFSKPTSEQLEKELKQIKNHAKLYEQQIKQKDARILALEAIIKPKP